jgi:hypothetical protein
MLMSEFLTTKELVEASRKAFEASKSRPREHFEHLVPLGWIDAQGRVTKLLGGTAEPEPHSKPRNPG